MTRTQQPELTEAQRQQLREQVELEESLALEQKRFNRAFDRAWNEGRKTRRHHEEGVRDMLANLTFGRAAKPRKTKPLEPLRGIEPSMMRRILDV